MTHLICIQCDDDLRWRILPVLAQAHHVATDSLIRFLSILKCKQRYCKRSYLIRSTQLYASEIDNIMLT